MNKNTMPIYIFIVLLTIGTIDSAYGDPPIYEKIQRKMQLDRIERNTNSARIKTRNQQNQQIRNNHNNSIVSVHPDYKEIAYGQEFPQWIGSMPPKELIRAKDIVYRGTADEIILLLTGYKGNYIPLILKRKRQVANSILGIKKKPAKPRKNYNIMNFEGIKNTFELAGNLAQLLTSPEYQASQRKARKAIGMVNKKEILLLIDDYVKLDKEKEKELNLYCREIANVHSDYQEILNNPEFYKFINNLPEKERKICNAIVDGGSVEEVNALLSAYKQSIRVETRAYIANTSQTTDNALNAHAVGEVVKLNNPSDDCVAFYKDSSLKEIIILFTNGSMAKVLETKGSDIYKVQVAERIGWVSGDVLK